MSKLKNKKQPYQITQDDINFTKAYTFKHFKCVDEDIMGAAMLGLCNAADSFDISKTNRNAIEDSFKCWLAINIKRAIIQYYRQNLSRRNIEFFKSLKFIPFDNNSLRLSQNGVEDRLIAKDLFHKLFNKLTDTQKRRFRKRYIEGQRNREIAKQEKVTDQAVDICFHDLKKRVNELSKQF